MVSQAALILRVITLWYLALSQFFRHGMGPFKHDQDCMNSVIWHPILQTVYQDVE